MSPRMKLKEALTSSETVARLADTESGRAITIHYDGYRQASLVMLRGVGSASVDLELETMTGVVSTVSASLFTARVDRGEISLAHLLKSILSDIADRIQSAYDLVNAVEEGA